MPRPCSGGEHGEEPTSKAGKGEGIERQRGGGAECDRHRIWNDRAKK